MPIRVHAPKRTRRLRKRAAMVLALDWKGERRWGDGHVCASEYEGHGSLGGQRPLARVGLSSYMVAQLIAGAAL